MYTSFLLDAKFSNFKNGEIGIILYLLYSLANKIHSGISELHITKFNSF